MHQPSKAARHYLASIGRRGGKARLTKMTASERREVARKAARARWAKQKSISSS